MANVTGEQLDVTYCPACKGRLANIPRDQMVSGAYTRADGTVAPETHTYECENCGIRFEINQRR